MNPRLIFGIFAFGFFGILAGFRFFGDSEHLRIVVKTISEESPYRSIHAEYPFFPQFSKSFNQKIENHVLEQIANFKVESEENREIRNASGAAEYESSLLIGWTPEQLTATTVSFIVRAESYTGGAHGRQTLATFSFDGEEKREISLDTIFAEVPNYLERISQFALSDLKTSLFRAGESEPNMEMLTAGTRPSKENFQHFTLGANGTITFYFPQYQVAPYVYGEQKVVMPLSFILGS